MTHVRNPRYTGRQVWNRQRKDEVLVDVHDVASGLKPTWARTPMGLWLVSEERVEPFAYAGVLSPDFHVRGAA